MLVTDILEYDKKKVLVQLDGHLILPLYKGEVSRYRIKKGEELSVQAKKELLQELLPKRVKLRAMNLLQKRSYTKEGLRRKLAEGKYPDYLVDEAVAYVASYHYVDDDRYAREYIRCYAETRSKRRIMQALFQKGVEQAVIESAWQAFETDNEPVDEVRQIYALLEKKGYRYEQADYKETRRVMNFLYRKGYCMDNILRCMHTEDSYTNL